MAHLLQYTQKNEKKPEKLFYFLPI